MHFRYTCVLYRLLTGIEQMPQTKLHSGIALIEVSEPMILAEIESDSALQPYLGERLSDTCIAVEPQSVQDVVRRLQSMGHMPRVVA